MPWVKTNHSSLALHFAGFFNYEIAPWVKTRHYSAEDNRTVAVSSSQVRVDWRMKHDILFLWNGTTFMYRSAEAGRFYMLTQAMLVNATKRTEWHGALKNFKGEFNVSGWVGGWGGGGWGGVGGGVMARRA